MSRGFCVAALCAACLSAHADDKLLPWQRWLEEPAAEQSRGLESLFALPWKSTGGKEGTLRTLDGPGPWGGKRFEFTVRIDHRNEGAYPQGWPAFEVQPDPKLDFSGYDAVTYWIRCDTQVDRALPIRFILWSGGEGRINELIPALKPGEWRQVSQSLRGVPALDKVDRLHFFLSESEYHHGDELVFQIGGFQLVKLRRVLSKLPDDGAACGLWLGERGDTGEQAVIVEQGARDLPALLVCEAGATASLRADDVVVTRFHDVFSGQEAFRSFSLGEGLAPGSTHRFARTANVRDLPPGYYLVTADVQRGGKSLLGGRVGCDDLYVKQPGESMTYTVLSIRTGMCEWVRDQLHGDIMCNTKIALPHVYDPLDKGTYAQFIDLHGLTTGKHTEGNEAGDTGLALAAEAFRKSGDAVRTAYAERLLLESCDNMIAHMQSPSGGAITWVNQLFDEGIGKGGGSQAFGGYDTNQMGEWMRAITYAILYCAQVPERRADAVRLSAAVRRTADYLMAHGAQDADGLPSVLRHLHLSEKGDGGVVQQTYVQEGRQCDVYLGRALAGVGYYAYAMQVLGERVPDAWWPILDNTVTWCDRKMKPNGWFDWQCEDVVEGGCHTFLGNIYIGEGLFGVCLADRLAGREPQATAAAAAAKRAYRYVTDDCYIKGKKYEYPLEFWVGPYVYWLFTEWLDTVGPDEKFTDWLTVLDRRWSVERGWHDFLDRAPTGGCGRTESNGMLAVSILGYLGIKQMQEAGQPLHWRAR